MPGWKTAKRSSNWDADGVPFPPNGETVPEGPNHFRFHLIHSQAYREASPGTGTDNLEIITEDVNAFETDDRYDRVVSVEMFEHVRNHRELFRRIHSWLKPKGKLFTHVFCHRSTSYPFEVEGEDDWMSKHFFSGGTMPADEPSSGFPGN